MTGLRRAVAVTAIILAPAVAAETVVLESVADNTIFGGPPTNSNGAGDWMFAGTTATGALRRALVRFDLAGAVPPGSTIDAVTLTLHMSMTQSGPQNVAIHRLLADWGEGESDSEGKAGGGGGAGARATPGDATWLHRFFDADFWAEQGGDFASEASAVTLVGSKAQVGYYDWGSTEAMVADVQSWLDDAEQNFGWVLVGNEAISFTAKRFDTREHDEPSFRPSLTVEFTPPADVPGDANGDGLVNVQDLVEVVTAWGKCPGRPAPCPADFDGNGVVDVVDLVAVIVNWS